MITTRELATLRAALRYWQEEMCPHGADAMRPYFDQPEVEPLSSDEIDELRQPLATTVRYALWTGEADRLADTEMFTSAEAAIRAAESGSQAVTVLLPVRDGAA